MKDVRIELTFDLRSETFRDIIVMSLVTVKVLL